MLQEYKEIYQQQANTIPDWKKINKNDLCNLYLENEVKNPYLAQCYLAAIICRYWTAIDKLYGMSYTAFSPEDCYSWLINAIMYALEHRRWKDPTCKLYTDPNGPDKVINRTMQSERLTAYQALNRIKRKANALVFSVEQHNEDLGDAYLSSDLTCDVEEPSTIKNLPKFFFRRQDYFTSFLTDIIMNYNVMDFSDEGKLQLNDKKVAHQIRVIDDKYCLQFSETYGIEYDRVLNGATYVTPLSSEKIKEKISNSLCMIKEEYPYLLEC